MNENKTFEDNSHWWWALGIGAVAAAAIGYYLWTQNQAEPPPKVVRTEAPAPAPAPPPAPAPEPVIQNPIEAPPVAAPLPALAESDAAAGQALSGLFGNKFVQEHFLLEGLVRRIVATVDNLPRDKVAQRVVPWKPVPGKFMLVDSAAGPLIGAENASRYAPFVKMLEGVNSKQAAAIYRHFYPLFQQAYQELGYPKGYFNDRLIEVIDHLLETPATPAVVKLTQPKVFFEYADPDLQARSAGQKILLRMGNENATRVKAKLRELRNELARRSPAPATESGASDAAKTAAKP